MSGWPQPPPRQGHAAGLRVPPISRSGSESSNRVTRAGRGFPRRWTPSRHFEAPPPSPRGGGRRFLVPASPPSPPGGGGRRFLVPASPPSPPGGGGRRCLVPASPPSPPGGGGRRCFVPPSPRCNGRLCHPRSSACGGSESGVAAARAGSQSLSWSLCRSHPSIATGRGRARAGRVNQASCGAVRHDCAALCHPQQRIDQRSAWRRRQSRQGPPGRAPSNPIH